MPRASILPDSDHVFVKGEHTEPRVKSTFQDGAVSSRLLYMIHTLDVLRDAGGTLSSTEVFSRLVESGFARRLDFDLVQPSGETRFAKEVRFARLELVEAGLLSCPKDGVWSLSRVGWGSFPTLEDARAMVSARRRGTAGRRLSKTQRVEGPTTGPRPGSHTGTFTRNADETSATYVLRFGRSDIWKIGHAKSLDGRLAAVNRHIPHEHLNERWSLFTAFAWPSEIRAYEMEQGLFRELSDYRTIGERVRFTRSILVQAWRANLTSALTPS